MSRQAGFSHWYGHLFSLITSMIDYRFANIKIDLQPLN